MKNINYPTGFLHKTINNETIITNKGLDLESMIEISNQYYYHTKKAWVVKYPTPIQVISTNNNSITKGYFKSPSCCDYIGFTNQMSFVFEAKVTESKTRFSFTQIAKHQLQHMKDALYYGTFAFIIVYFKTYDQCYFLNATTLFDAIQKGKKSYTIEQFKQSNSLIESKGLQCPLDYIKFINYGGFHESKNNTPKSKSPQ